MLLARHADLFTSLILPLLGFAVYVRPFALFPTLFCKHGMCVGDRVQIEGVAGDVLVEPIIPGFLTRGG